MFGVRATPAGQRNNRSSEEARPNSAFDPFREDFEFIVAKLKEEEALGLRQHAAASRAAPRAVDTVLEMESMSEDEANPRVFGETYSILDYGKVNEMYERKVKPNALWEAVRLLRPTSRRSWMITLALVGIVLMLWSASQFRTIEESKSNVLLEQQFWWGFLAGRKRVWQREGYCRTTPVGSQGTVVDSSGQQCLEAELDAETRCCFGGLVPVARTGHGAHCRSCSDADGCCVTQEDCVECCMVPDHWRLLRFQLFALSRNGFPGLTAADFDRFELCQAVCRTHRDSLDRHGQYLGMEGRERCYHIPDERAQTDEHVFG